MGDDAERLLSVTEIARRPDESLYIKKCLLVNAEIDRMGMVSDEGMSVRDGKCLTSYLGQVPVVYLGAVRTRLPVRSAYRASFRACVESA